MVTVDNKYILSNRFTQFSDPAVSEAFKDTTTSSGQRALSRMSVTMSARALRLEQTSTTLDQLNRQPFMRLIPRNTSDTIYEFYFPYMPIEISYDNLSDEVVEIARPGTTPIVAFKSHRLMKISFQFIVTVPLDGLFTDVEDSLNLLRKFATNSNRVVKFFNMDSMLETVERYRNSPASILSDGPQFFNIVDLSVSAVRRSTSGKITQATVNVTMVENQNPVIATVPIPPIPKRKHARPSCKKKNNCPDKKKDIKASLRSREQCKVALSKPIYYSQYCEQLREQDE